MSEDNTNRTRTIVWDDPLEGLPARAAMSGLDYMRAMIAGRIPQAPIAHLMGFRLVEVEEGRALFSGEPAEYHYNPIGAVHGGLAATLLDSAMGCSIHTALPAGTSYTTVELHVNYIRPLTRDTGTVHCEGRIVHVGRQLATAEGRLFDASGKLYAHGTTTCLVFTPQGQSRDGAADARRKEAVE